MKYSLAVSISLAMALMLSPETLVLFQNSLGSSGVFYFGALIAAFFGHSLTVQGLRNLRHELSGPGGETRFLRDTVGAVPATVFPVCSRVLLTVCILPYTLSRAGFVFNEVFLTWFPNFGFAFLLLGLLYCVNLASRRAAPLLQAVFAGIVLCGLVVFCAVGFMQGSSPGLEESGGPALSVSGLCTAFLVFIGYDLFLFIGNGRASAKNQCIRPMQAGLAIAVALFCLWGGVSLLHVEGSRLAETTIPYMITARKIMGQPGRLLMGVIIISGACAVVNGLLLSVSRMLVGMAREGLLPRCLALSENKAAVPLTLLAGSGALMMASGMAGNENLDIYLRAGLLLWLLHYALLHLSILLSAIRGKQFSFSLAVARQSLLGSSGLLLYLLIFAALVLTDSARVHLMKFMLLVLAGVTFLSLGWQAFSRRNT